MTDDKRAIEIIQARDEEKQKRSNFDNLYQQVSDLMIPIENQITGQKTPGEDKSLLIRDPTGVVALDRATAGFIAAWIPKDRPFFGIRIQDSETAEIDHVKRWCSTAVRIAHEEFFAANYMSQLQPTVKSAIGLGICNFYSEWDNNRLGLNYKDYHISTYTIKQNSKGIVDVVILDLPRTARQAAEEYSNKAGEQALKDANDIKTESKVHDYIRIDRPRAKYNRIFNNSTNKPFEAIVVNVKEKSIVKEEGYNSFPYSVARWERSSCEKYGRGRGTIFLSAVKELQQMRKDFLECGNSWNRPPRWKLANAVEGPMNLSPDGVTEVLERDAFGAVDQRISGNFPITMETLKFQQEFIKNDGFYNDIFSQFRDLQGDRRVTLELELRNQEGLDQLVAPVINMEYELFTPQITRDILTLIRNGRIPPPPEELRGQPFVIEYTGKLAMSMKQYQARGFMQLTQILGGLAPMLPDGADMICADRALPDIAMALGVKMEHLSTPEEVAAKRKQRLEDKQKLELAQAAQVAGEAYQKTSKKAEAGSPAEQLVGV